MIHDVGTVATLVAALGFIGIGYATDYEVPQFRHFLRFGMTPHAYWALAFWMFFALSVNYADNPPWLTALNGFLAVAMTLHHLYLRFKAHRARKTTEEPTE